MGTRYIHLIRHGQYHTDKDHPQYGSLTTLGRQQAQCVARRLRDHKLQIIHISTMTRAQETGEILRKSFLQVKSRNCGLLVEGIPVFPDKLIRQNKMDRANLKKAKVRMNRAFKKYFTPYKGKGDRHEALVCHGNIIRYLITKAIGVETLSWINFDIYQCSLTTVSVEADGTMKLLTFGEIGHVPPSKRTHI
jgi:serine/threonine-protein phosphatase PGAM5